MGNWVVRWGSVSCCLGSTCCRCEFPRFKLWLDKLLWEEGGATEDIFRMKGLLQVPGTDKKQVFQVRPPPPPFPRPSFLFPPIQDP